MPPNGKICNFLILVFVFVAICEASASATSVGSYGNNNFVTSVARFCKIFIDGPTPQAIAYLISVCIFAGLARPTCIGKFIPAA